MKNWQVSVAATLGLAMAAHAQPAAFTDLGNHDTAAEQFSQEVTALAGNDVQWYRIVLPAAPAASSGYVDIWTVNGGANPMTDTEVGIFDNAGTLISDDDDSGPGFYTVLTFGGGSGQQLGEFNSLGGDNFANGEDGPLAGGVYWVAVGRYPVAYASGFSAVSTSGLTQTTTTLNFAVAPATAPFPPSVTAATAGPSPALAGSALLVTASVSPGGNPPSTGLVVRVNLGALGGSATQVMFDNGTNGDVTAADGIYSYAHTTPANQGGGTFPIVISASDAQSRTGTRTVNYIVSAPPAVYTDMGTLACGETTMDLSIDAAQEIKWFKMTLPNVADPISYLDIWTTVASTINLQDTELALFDSNGVLKATDDDDGGGSNSYLSEISFGATSPIRETGGAGWAGGNGRDGALTSGVHWLAVCGFNVNPANGWLMPSTSTYVGSVQFKTNLQHDSCSGNCVADLDDGTGTGTSDGAVNIDDLIFFLIKFEAGDVVVDIDNGTQTGTTDDAVNVDDLIYFLIRFEQGC
jgi:hypothetical protein